jgi:hypothetical protein
LKPSGGFLIKSEPRIVTKTNNTPKIVKVLNTSFPPFLFIKASATGVNTSPPNPRAETIIPVIRPLLSGNHF